MINIGFECEYFTLSKGKHVVCPKTVPSDDCGWLAEARGKPLECPIEAAFSMMADRDKVRLLASKDKIKLGNMPFAELEPDLMREARRTYGKRDYPVGRGNLYGLDYASTDTLARAGLHVHFSHFHENSCVDDKGVRRYFRSHSPINMPKIIRLLDTQFRKEIEHANRLCGEYEMKPYGFEYRSLPNNIDVIKVAHFIRHSMEYMF